MVGQHIIPGSDDSNTNSTSFISKHPNLKEVEAGRTAFNPAVPIKVVKLADPYWKYGQGANDSGASLKKQHVEIDPFAEGRPWMANYKLLISEWTVSGLHQAPSKTVKSARVQESVFSIEGKLTDVKEFTSHAKPGMSIARVALIEATGFWICEDAVNAEQTQIDLNILRPVAQLASISYGRVTETFELPRSSWDDASKEAPWLAEQPGAKGDEAPAGQWTTLHNGDGIRGQLGVNVLWQ